MPRVESMTACRWGSGDPADAAGIGIGPWPQSIKDRFGVNEFSQFTGAEMIARKYGFTRDELDAFALDSHRKGGSRDRAGHSIGCRCARRHRKEASPPPHPDEASAPTPRWKFRLTQDDRRGRSRHRRNASQIWMARAAC